MTDVLILHGLDGSGPGHWQRWMAEELAAAGVPVRVPDLPDPDAPALEAWLAALADEPLAGTTVLCHSLACLLWLHAAARGTTGAARVLLVAPPSPASDVPELKPFLPVSIDPDAVAAAADSTSLLCGTGDPYCPEGAHTAYAGLRVPTTVVPEGGHLNVDAGYGPWPDLLTWVLRGGSSRRA